MVLAALSPPERADAIAAIVLAETTTLGVRRASLHRDVVARSSETIETGLGAVRVKLVATPAGSGATGIRRLPPDRRSKTDAAVGRDARRRA